MLSRRIPLVQAPPPQSPIPPPAPPPKQHVSAVPSYLQRSVTIGGPPSRTQSPQIPYRPLTPPVNAPAPYRPGSPFNRNRQSTMIQTPPARTQSPAPVSPRPPPLRTSGGIEVDLVVRSIPRESLVVDVPFTVACTVTVSALVPVPVIGLPRKQRVISLAIQHLQPPRLPTTKLAPSHPEPWSPRLPSSGLSTPSPYGTPFRGNFHDTLAQKLLVASPREIAGEIESDAGTEVDDRETAQETPAPLPSDRRAQSATPLPPPFLAAVDSNGEPTRMPSREVHFLGVSAMFLPPLNLLPPETLDLSSLEETVKTPTFGPSAGQGHERNWSESTVTTSESDADSELEVLANKPILNRSTRVLASQDFELEYVPRTAGFLSVGGLRVVLVDDRLIEETDGEAGNTEANGEKKSENVTNLKEVEIVAEVWVETSPSTVVLL